MSKRTKRETVADMLSVLSEKPRKPTHLLYKANLSHPRMKKLLTELVEAGLVFENGEEISITDKGLRFLQEYRRAQNLFESFGL